VVTVADSTQICRLHRAEGTGIKSIARRLAVACNTVSKAVRFDSPPQYDGRVPRLGPRPARRLRRQSSRATPAGSQFRQRPIRRASVQAR
jgi:hypothetical protein